jgi:ribosomal protein L16 Arg81 hydroxylase
VLSVTLGPGDALYLPRGYIHAAETNVQRSIHLTVGVLATTAYDVVRDVLELIAGDEEFRRPLPLGGPDAQLAAVAGIVADTEAARSRSACSPPKTRSSRSTRTPRYVRGKDWSRR